MSFLDGLGRFLQGKPVFEDPNAPVDRVAPAPQQSPSEDRTGVNKADHNSFPVIRIEEVSSHESNGHLEVHGEVKNEWHDEVVLDKIQLFNTSRKLEVFLRADEEREVLLYDGPAPMQPYYEALLEYKTRKEGDYFQATFEVKLDYDAATKTYSTDELRLRLPIRDIYG